MTRLLVRDEREAGIDLTADRLTSMVMSYGLLVIVVYRGFVLGEASWDLLGLVVGGSVVGLAYRAHKRAVSARWVTVLVATTTIAAILAAIIVVVQLPR